MGADNYERELEDADNQISRDKARIAKLEDALKYYANSDWDSGCQCCISDTKSATNPVIDEGQRAREALKDE
jgi:hypothetical protein